MAQYKIEFIIVDQYKVEFIIFNSILIYIYLFSRNKAENNFYLLVADNLKYEVFIYLILESSSCSFKSYNLFRIHHV